MSTLEGIAPEFRTEAGMITRMPALILIMGTLLAGTVVYAGVVNQSGRPLFAFALAIILMAFIVFYARHKWRTGRRLLETLRNASQLMHTANPQTVQVTSWYLYNHNWYLAILPLDAQPDAPVQAFKVWLPYTRVKIDDPTPAEIFRSAESTVVRLQDGKVVLLTTEPDELRQLADHPLPMPPRHIPLWVQLQMLTYHGAGIAFLCFASFFIAALFNPKLPVAQSIPSIIFALIISGIFLVWGTASLAYGYRAWRRLKYAPLGSARVDEVDPSKVKFGLFAPSKQSIHLRIRDQQGQEYEQTIVMRQWRTYWPRYAEIPVLFDPSGHEKPLQFHAIIGFCRINEQGQIIYHPLWAAMTVFYFIWAGMAIFAIFSGH